MRDIRVRTGFCDHPKTLRLVAAAGEGAVRCLLRFWGWVADNRPQGDLGDMTAEEIEHQARWTGKAGKFVDALRGVGFLDGEPGGFSVHDWEAEQPYVFHAEKRVTRAKKAAAARYSRDGEPGGAEGKEGGSRTAPTGSSAPSNATGSAPSMPDAAHEAGGGHAGGNADGSAGGNAPSPAPTPPPAPLAEETPSPGGEGEPPAAPAAPLPSPAGPGQEEARKRTAPDCPYEAIRERYNRLLADKHGLPRCEKMSDKRRRALRPRWVEHPDLAWWDRYFGVLVPGQRFLLGNNPRGWRADFDFLARESGMLGVLEGKYAGGDGDGNGPGKGGAAAPADPDGSKAAARRREQTERKLAEIRAKKPCPPPDYVRKAFGGEAGK